MVVDCEPITSSVIILFRFGMWWNRIWYCSSYRNLTSCIRRIKMDLKRFKSNEAENVFFCGAWEVLLQNSLCDSRGLLCDLRWGHALLLGVGGRVVNSCCSSGCSPCYRLENLLVILPSCVDINREIGPLYCKWGLSETREAWHDRLQLAFPKENTIIIILFSLLLAD